MDPRDINVACSGRSCSRWCSARRRRRRRPSPPWRRAASAAPRASRPCPASSSRRSRASFPRVCKRHPTGQHHPERVAAVSLRAGQHPRRDVGRGSHHAAYPTPCFAPWPTSTSCTSRAPVGSLHGRAAPTTRLGTAVDLGNWSQARSAMLRAGCRHPYPGTDDVHFDCPGADRRSDSVRTFQRLWNVNNPSDRLTEDGAYGPMTESRLGRAPAAGFARNGCDTTPPTPALAATLVRVSCPAEAVAGSRPVAFVEYRNTGTATWQAPGTRLGTTGPRDRRGAFYDTANWVAPNRPSTVDAPTAPGATGRFSFVFGHPRGDHGADRHRHLRARAGGRRVVWPGGRRGALRGEGHPAGGRCGRRRRDRGCTRGRSAVVDAPDAGDAWDDGDSPDAGDAWATRATQPTRSPTRGMEARPSADEGDPEAIEGGCQCRAGSPTGKARPGPFVSARGAGYGAASSAPEGEALTPSRGCTSPLLAAAHSDSFGARR